MLEKLFTSGTRVKILTLLMFNQNAEYHLRQMARILKVSPIYASKELENLIKINLVRKSKKGNLNLYSINKKSSIFKDLKNIFLKTDYFGELIKKELIDKAKYVFIFGSFAIGDETESSDIDLFVIGDTIEDDLIKIVQKAEKASGREVNYILWTQKTFDKRAKGHHLLKKIKNSKVIMLVGDENEFKKAIR